MSVLKVMADNLGPGAVPAYEVPEDWPFPILTIGSDGTSIVRVRPSGRRVFLEIFQISGSEQDIKDRIGDVLTSLVLTAGFAGRATVAISSDYFIGTEAGPVHVLAIGVMFTADWELGEMSEPGVVQWSAPSSWMPDGFPELEAAADDLLEGFFVMDVMLS